MPWHPGPRQSFRVLDSLGAGARGLGAASCFAGLAGGIRDATPGLVQCAACLAFLFLGGFHFLGEGGGPRLCLLELFLGPILR